jgi:ATP synthase protein I
VQDSTDKIRSAAYKMLFIEAIITGVIALFLVLGVSAVYAISVLVGGLAYIIPNAYFTKYVFRYSAADSPRLAVRGFYLGETIKIFATVLIFTFGFLLIKQLNVPALVMTYISMLILNLWGNSILMTGHVDKAGDLENKNNGD